MGEKGVVVGAIVVAYVLVPPLARSWPTLVNGFLILILFASILMHSNIWLPYLNQLSGAASKGSTTTAQRPLPSRADTLGGSSSGLR